MGARDSLLPVLCLLVGLSIAGAWRSKDEYTFELNGRTLAYIPSLGNNMTGVHYKGQLRLQKYASGMLLMQLRNVSYVRVQKYLVDDWWEQVPNEQYRSMPLSESTFSAKLNNGMVENLVVTSSMENWEMNFIQGIVSHLQFDLTGGSSKHDPKSNSMPGRGDYESATTFSIMEEAVSGRCEVLYQMTEIPKPVMLANPDWAAREDLCGRRPFMEVVKTRNYSNCEKNPEYHFGLPNSPYCQPGSDRCGDLWTRASVTQMVGCGLRRDFMLLTSISAHKVVANLHLHNGTEAAVKSYLNLTLISAKPVSQKLGLPSLPTRSLHGLTYQYKPPYSPSTVSMCQEVKPANHHRGDRTSSSVEHSSENSEEIVDSLELPSEEEIKHHYSHKSKHHNTRTRQKRATKRPKSTTTEQPFDSIPEISTDKTPKQWWKLPAVNYQRPPHRPFSAFSLSHSEGDAHSCINPQFKELISDIAGDMENPKLINEKMTLEKVKIAVDMCRTMMLVDLQKCQGGLMDFESPEKSVETQRKVLRDIYAMCGTNPALNIIKTWIVKKKLTSEEAATLIATLPANIQTPTTETVNEFFDLIRNPTVKGDEQMQISAVLAFSNLLRTACVLTKHRDARYSVALLEPVCTPKTASRYLPWFTDQLHTNSSQRSVFLTALGNTAHPSALSILRAVAEDSNMTPYIRSTAVFSMKYLALAEPDAMSQVLMGMYSSYKNPLSMRMAALSLLMYTNPGLPIWQRIAVATWYEPSPAMVSFVWTSINSMAAAQDSKYQPMFESARAILPITKPAALASHLPENFLWTAVTHELSSIVMDQFSWSSDLQASHVYLRPTHRMGKIPHLMAQAEMSAANPDGLLQLFLDFMMPKEDLKTIRPPLANIDRTTRWIHEKLKIAARSLPRIEGGLRYSLNNLHERIIPFDKKIIDDALKAGRKAMEELKEGKPFHYQKMDQQEMEIGTANELGLPISLRLKTIFLTRSTGATQLSPDNMHITADFNLVYASQLMAELTAFPEWDGLEYIAASYVTTYLKVPPIHLATNINKTASQVQLKVKFGEKGEDVQLMQNSKPFIAQRDLLILTPMALSQSTHFFPVTKPISFASMSHMNITYASNGEPSTLPGWLHDGVTIYGIPMVWHTLEPAFFKMELTNLAPIQVNLTIVTGEMENGDLSLQTLLKQSPGDVQNGTITAPIEPVIGTQNASSTERTVEASTSSTTTSTISTTTSTVATTASTSMSTSTPTSTPNSPTSTSTSPTSSISTTAIPEEILEDESRNLTITNMNQKSDAEFNATIVDPFSGTKNGSHFKYLLDKLLSKIDNGAAVAVGINYTLMTVNPAKYHGFIAYGNEVGGSTKRAAFYLKDNQSNWQIGVTSDLYLVPGPLLDIGDMLKRNETTKLAVSFMKRSGNGTTVASLKGSAAHSEPRNLDLRHSADVRHCMQDIADSNSSAYVHSACRKAAQQAAFADRFEAQLRLSVSVDDRQLLGWINGNGSAIIRMSNKQDTADLLMRFSSAELEYTGMRIPFLLSKAIRQYNPDHSSWEQLTGTASCGITADDVMTYDGVYFPYRMGNCWHVLTKDCSGKSRVVVLGKTEKNVMVVEVNVDNFKVISLHPDLQIIINEKPVKLTTNQAVELEDRKRTVIAQITTSPDKVIRVRLPEHDLTVMYANSTALISAGFGNRGRLCGMCGDHDGEKVGDLKNPYGALEQHPQKFAASYALHTDNCEDQRKL